MNSYSRFRGLFDQHGISCFLPHMHSPFCDSSHLWSSNDVLHKRNLCVWAWPWDCPEASGLHTPWPALNPNLGFILWIAFIRHWVPPFHGGLCQGQRVSELLRQGLRHSSCFHGFVENLLWEKAWRSGLGLAKAGCGRHCSGPFMGFPGCILLEGEVWLGFWRWASIDMEIELGWLLSGLLPWSSNTE